MEFRIAEIGETQMIYELVQTTIKEIYPKYYPQAVVDFFCKHHSVENISSDIDNSAVYLLLVNGEVIGTGSINKNHITRLFVLPKYQNKGFGSEILIRLESKIFKNYSEIFLDASLSASQMYENRGYKTVKHESIEVENGAVLVYEIMKKE